MNVYRVTYSAMGMKVSYDVLAATPKYALEVALKALKKKYERHKDIHFKSLEVVASNILK